MKAKVSKKEIMESYPNVISVGYCNLQNLLHSLSPRYYTSNQYGWGADVYEIDAATVIVTGYAPFGNIKPSYELTHEYEKKAEKLWERDWRTRERTRKVLLRNYIKKVLADK